MPRSAQTVPKLLALCLRKITKIAMKKASTIRPRLVGSSSPVSGRRRAACRRRVGQQALRRVEFQHLARAQHQDAVEVDDGLQTVRDRQHRRAVLPRVVAENFLLTRQSRYKR